MLSITRISFKDVTVTELSSVEPMLITGTAGEKEIAFEHIRYTGECGELLCSLWPDLSAGLLSDCEYRSEHHAVLLSLPQNGTVQCEAISCPPPQCPAGTAPAYVKGACCKECQREWSTLNLIAPLHSYNREHNRAQTHFSLSHATPKQPPLAPDLERATRLHKGCLTIDQGLAALLSYLLTCLLRWARPFAYTWTNQLFTSLLQNTDGHQSHGQRQ